MKKIFVFSFILALLFGAIITVTSTAGAIYTADEENRGEENRNQNLNLVTSTVPSLLRSDLVKPALKNDKLKADLEKIPSPEFIKQYSNIVKQGAELWGVKKPQADNQGLSKAPSENKLEKIIAPQFASLYEKIKKVGNALWGMPKKPVRIVTSDLRACVITAIDLKDESVSENNLKVATDINLAISARNACQKTAFNATSSQMIELHKCVAAFKDARQKIKEESNKLHSTIWNKYKTDLISCWKNSTSTIPAATSTVKRLENNNNFSDVIIEDGSENLSEMITSVGQNN